MPVKWDAEKDKFLLNCLLMDATVNIGSAVVENIISSWPSEFGDAPTKKAVGEHFFKIRKLNKKFSTTSSINKTNGIITPRASPAKVTKPRATPSKKKTAAAAAAATENKSTPLSKRKRVAVSDNDDAEGEDVNPAVLQAELDGLVDNNATETDESPTKRARGVVKYEETDDEGALMSGSDFRDDDEV